MNTVLVIEDNLSNYILIQDILEGLNFEVMHAINGRDGINLVQTHMPHLIMLDLRMPEIDGWEVAQILKSDAHLSQIPIIAVSVPVEPDDEQRALEAGCNAFVPKPFNIRQFRQVIAQYVN